MKKRGVLVAVLAAVVILGSVLAASRVMALTAWQSFGVGWAHNRGDGFGSPDIWVSSVSKPDPEKVRFTVTNHAGESRKVTIFWDLVCWKKGDFGFNDDVTNKSGNYDKTITGGAVHEKEFTFSSSAEWCELDVWVFYESGGDNGKLTLKLQAKY
jgi:hypothetical protein